MLYFFMISRFGVKTERVYISVCVYILYCIPSNINKNDYQCIGRNLRIENPLSWQPYPIYISLTRQHTFLSFLTSSKIILKTYVELSSVRWVPLFRMICTSSFLYNYCILQIYTTAIIPVQYLSGWGRCSARTQLRDGSCKKYALLCCLVLCLFE